MFTRTLKQFLVLPLLVVSQLAMAAPIKITHSMGTTLLPEVPKRVVVLGMDSLDVLDAIGVEPVGVVKAPMPSYLKKYQADKYQAVGSLFEPNFEAIYTLKPDLIIVSNRSARAFEELSKIAPSIMFVADPKQFWQSTTAAWSMLGKVFNKQEKVETYIKEQSAQIDKIKAYNQARKTDALVVMKNGGNLTTFGGQSRFSAIFDLFGFTASADNDSSYQHGDLISYEYIVKANPQYMLVLDRDAAIGRPAQSAQEAFNNPLINKLDVYKQGHIHYLNSAAWYISASGIQATQIMIDDIKAALVE